MNLPVNFFNFFENMTFSGKAIADLTFFIISGLVAVFSLILFFHWKRYGMGGFVLAITEMIYIIVAISLLLGAFLALN